MDNLNRFSFSQTALLCVFPEVLAHGKARAPRKTTPGWIQSSSASEQVISDEALTGCDEEVGSCFTTCGAGTNDVNNAAQASL